MQASVATQERQLSNKGIGIAVVMLVVWAVGTALEWSGWVHGLLTAGVFLLIWSIVGRPPRGSGAAR